MWTPAFAKQNHLPLGPENRQVVSPVLLGEGAPLVWTNIRTSSDQLQGSYMKSEVVQGILPFAKFYQPHTPISSRRSRTQYFLIMFRKLLLQRTLSHSIYREAVRSFGVTLLFSLCHFLVCVWVVGISTNKLEGMPPRD